MISSISVISGFNAQLEQRKHQLFRSVVEGKSSMTFFRSECIPVFLSFEDWDKEGVPPPALVVSRTHTNTCQCYHRHLLVVSSTQRVGNNIVMHYSKARKKRSGYLAVICCILPIVILGTLLTLAIFAKNFVAEQRIGVDDENNDSTGQRNQYWRFLVK